MSVSIKNLNKEQLSALTSSNKGNNYNTTTDGTDGAANAGNGNNDNHSQLSSFDGYENGAGDTGHTGTGRNDNNDSLRTTKRKVRGAYKLLDSKQSKQAHEHLIELNDNGNTESHKKHGEFVKSIIYGGLDGVFTTFALVAGFQGAGSTFEDAATMLVFGFANVVADALSMGFGDYLSERAEIDFAVSERAREEWEFDNYKQGEIDEMIQIYVNKGMTHEDASNILNTMAKYKDFFIDHMMIQELEIYPVNLNAEDYDPYAAMKNGIVTFTSFLIFGSIPLLSYVIFEIIQVNKTFEEDVPNFKFYACVLLSILALMTLGLVKGKLTDSNLLWSTTFVTLNGVVAAAASYLLGWGLGKVTGIDE